MYNFKEVEKKWQEYWNKSDDFKAIDFHPTKPKYYILYEFFNISGNLHMGHLKGTVPADALARYKRFAGYNVLFPIGGDSFGLPAENAAIKYGTNPVDFVQNGMKNAMEQSKKIGLSFDYDRSFATSDPSYYKWTQWIFLQLLKHGKAYKEKGTVNFCTSCKTVLSNEDSQNGICDRCGTPVIQEERNVWFLKMREYSEHLLNNIEKIDMNDNLKESQRNWIGKSEGHNIVFNIVDSKNNFLFEANVFTTCIETIFGVTFLTFAPESNFISQFKEKIKNFSDIDKYRIETLYKNELERISNVKDKTGFKIEGIFALNPMTNEKIPVYVSDYVIANYGSGVVMGVPAHDQRDFDFAKHFNIPSLQVIDSISENKVLEKKDYLKSNSQLINSSQFSGLTVKKAKEEIFSYLNKQEKCFKKTNYKMQDWSFNRQRYWGEPFPVVFCEKCGTIPIPENELPLTLPKISNYISSSDGNSPLANVTDWVNTHCPNCGGSAIRETDTMPNWAGSSWYWLRYIDPHNNEKLADFEKLKYWGSVDCYTGGTEHITRHVLYAFFWQNFLYEIGVVPTREPFSKKLGSGLILDDTGKKMSKSSTNGVSPLEVIDKHGCDVTRLHLHFLGGYEDNTPWTYKGINGIENFINKVWNLQNIIVTEVPNEKRYVKLNQLIKKITDDIESFKLNTAIANFMSYINFIRDEKGITKEELKVFLILLNPLAPHITSEMFEILFKTNILDETWPKFNESLLVENNVNLAIQVNGKFKKTIIVKRDSDEKVVVNLIKNTYPLLVTSDIKKVIYVTNKIINFIC